MKKVLFGLIGVVFVGLLSSCEIMVEGSIDVRPIETVGVASSEYRYDGLFVVCDDRPTTLHYDLTLSSSADEFETHMVGPNSGRDIFIESIRLNEAEREAGEYHGSFVVGSQVAPLRAGASLSPQSIVVVPEDPEFIGNTYIKVVVYEDNTNVIYLGPLPVLNYC